MTTKTLDITGKVCPYCGLAVLKASAQLDPSDDLVVTCDHPPAATVSIPALAADAGMACTSRKIAPGLWELRLRKK